MPQYNLYAHDIVTKVMYTFQTHNLWLRPKRPPLAFSVAETSVAEMSGPKRPRPKCPHTVPLQQRPGRGFRPKRESACGTGGLVKWDCLGMCVG